MRSQPASSLRASIGNVYVENSGDITATAITGDYSYDNQADAYGIVAYNYDGSIGIVNDGSISASASSGAGTYDSYANAIGVSAVIGTAGYGGIYVYNSGSISATAEDSAVGVGAYNGGDYGSI